MSFAAPRELLALRDFFDTHDPAPNRVRSAAYAAVDQAMQWRTAAALELVADSADAATSAKVRSGHAEPRVLTFAMPGRILEMDLTPTFPGHFRASGMVISRAGQGMPCGDVVLRHPQGCQAGALDERGCFRVDDIPCGPLSVVFRPAFATPAVADWFVC